MTWLIDRAGVSWLKQAHPIAQWEAACDPVAFAVADLGFIHLRLLNGGVTVNFNPSRVGRKTMISAFYVIASERPNRIGLSYGGNCKIVRTVGEAFREIEELVETQHPAMPTVAQRRQSLDHLPTAFARPIVELLHVWNDTAGQWTPERHADLSKAVPLNDTVVVRSPRGTDRVVNNYWGANFNNLGLRWPGVAQGKDVEDHPFPQLGKWSAFQYRRTLAGREPYLQAVDLALSRAGSTILNISYNRLMLPWNDRSGDRYVTVIRFDKSPTQLPSGFSV
jgi:hypothetical protein